MNLPMTAIAPGLGTPSKHAELPAECDTLPNAYRVLVVDDNVVGLKLLEQSLTNAGFVVVTACNGAEAMVRIEEQDFGAAVIDLMMPVVGGLEFLRWLRITRQSSLPVLVFTGQERSNAIQSGATEVLVKPAGLKEIRETVRRLIGSPV